MLRVRARPFWSGFPCVIACSVRGRLFRANLQWLTRPKNAQALVSVDFGVCTSRCRLRMVPCSNSRCVFIQPTVLGPASRRVGRYPAPNWCMLSSDKRGQLVADKNSSMLHQPSPMSRSSCGKRLSNSLLCWTPTLIMSVWIVHRDWYNSRTACCCPSSFPSLSWYEARNLGWSVFHHSFHIATHVRKPRSSRTDGSDSVISGTIPASAAPQ
mmetsp:Transcript_6879/g.14606  ORF Transcript_6879/g.14606 Transcript_6879/m.14606 type:complete len:212 (+) Transcript_6879:238-873(+)